jgi:hypothetical protein
MEAVEKEGNEARVFGGAAGAAVLFKREQRSAVDLR